MEAGRGFLWLPVAFGIGILVYFALPREPSALALVALALGPGARRLAARGAGSSPSGSWSLRPRSPPGSPATKLRTDRVAAPMLQREMTATVDRLGRRARGGGARRRARPLSASTTSTGSPEPDADDRPRHHPQPGRRARRRRRDRACRRGCSRRAGRSMPGGYDFARAAFYDGIGARRLRLWRRQAGRHRPGAARHPPDASRSPSSATRSAGRIEAALPGDNGHIAAALVMGDQGGISEETQEAMRASGLGHVLSISGLHMALVAGSAFWLIRALLALSPALALTPADQEMGGRRRRSPSRPSISASPAAASRPTAPSSCSRSCSSRCCSTGGRSRSATSRSPRSSSSSSRRRACSSPASRCPSPRRVALVAAYEAISRARRPAARRSPTRRHRPRPARCGGRRRGLFLTSLDRRPRHRALRRLPLPARRAADAPRQPRRDAGGRPHRHADGAASRSC